MSHDSTNSHMVGHDDPHNHKHTGTAQILNLSDRFFEPLDRQIVAWLKLAPGSRVLDAGCGGGGMTRLLAEAVGPQGEVVGLDANPQLLEWGESQLKGTELVERVKLQEGDITNLPFEAGRFDFVWCSRVVHGLPDQLAGVRELARVVRPGGRLALREGGLPVRFMPVDIGMGSPGLEGRLEAAQVRWFANWRQSLPDSISYPFGWSHMLREAGLNSVAPKTFLAEFTSPLEEYQIEYLKSRLSHYINEPATRQLLADQDAQILEQLLLPDSPHYVFNRDDLHGIVAVTIYSGTV